MRIERIEIDGFGRFHDASWELPPGLTVLLGANEAGKTTLLNALRALLFGFEPSRDGRAWYPALAGGRRGGRLVLRGRDDARWVVERHGERGGPGALAVRAPNGNQGGQETLDRLLHGADRDLFTNIFAFGLGELQTFASLSADGVRGRIYGARAGLGGTSAVDLERRLRHAMDEAWLPRGSQRPMNRLLGRIEELRSEIAALARQPVEHAEAHRERRRHAAEAVAARDEARRLRRRVARLEAIRAAVPVVAELDAREAELAAGDATLDAIADDAGATLDRLVAERDRARAVLAAIDERLDDARRDRAAVRRDDAVLSVADEVASLGEERVRRHADEARRADLEVAMSRAASVVREQLERAGESDERRLLAIDGAIGSIEATRAHEAELARARAARTDAEARCRSLADELEAGAPEDTGLDPVDLDRRAELARELAALRLAAGRPDRASPGMGRVAVAAAVVILAASAAVGWLVDALLIVVAIGSALAALVIALRPGTQAAPDGSADARASELATRLGLPPDHGHDELQALLDEVAVARARRDLQAAHRSRDEARHDELVRRERELEAATTALARAEEAWRCWLDEHGLAPALTPEAARQVMAVAGAARRAATERDDLAGQLAAVDGRAEAHAARVDALAATLGLPVTTDSPRRDAFVIGLGERVEEARDAARRAADLDEAIARADARRRPAVEELEAATASLERHLEAAGCPDPDALARRIAAADRRRSLRAEERSVRQRLVGIAGGAGELEGLRSEGRRADPAGLDAASAELATELAAAEEREQAASAAIGALDARIAQLEAAAELGDRRQELAQLEGQAAAMARDWSVRALALHLLSATRARHERERQPDVVRAAEAHFDRITGGRYARIVAPPGEASVRVETEGGESRTTDELSRGTAEQLYLALRFGLIEEFARHAEAMPVVMDDILVNFDADRAGRAASAIGQLASRHQVLYFTCHPWTAALLDPDGERTLALE